MSPIFSVPSSNILTFMCDETYQCQLVPDQGVEELLVFPENLLVIVHALLHFLFLASAAICPQVMWWKWKAVCR
jgi:hypothetical protein